MRTLRCLLVGSVLVVIIVGAGPASSGEGCCAHCGRAQGCEKVCKLVREEKTVELICWGTKSENFCLGGPSTPGCKHCDDVCDTCDEHYDPLCGLVPPRKFVWYEWRPGCATVHTKKKLMKKTVTRKIPSYKWMVEDLCPECEAKLADAVIEPGMAIPPPPLAGAALKLDESALIAPPLQVGADQVTR